MNSKLMCLTATDNRLTYLLVPHSTQAALKVRKGDFDHIVDDVSDGEGDEAAGAAARAEMELQEDRARDRAIITAVTEGHDAMRKMQKKGKYTFEKLVGGGENRRETAGEYEHRGMNCADMAGVLVYSEQRLLTWAKNPKRWLGKNTPNLLCGYL
jgi:hypothetical protein